MKHSGIGWLGLLLGAAVIAAGQIVGSYVEGAATAGGQAAWEAALRSAKFYFYGLSLPLGLSLAALGAGLAAGLGGRVLGIILAGVVAVGLLTPWNFASIQEPAALFFGVGGNAIAFMVLVALLLWARSRPGQEGAAGRAADFRLLGLIFLGSAAWLVCGLGAYPVYGIHPDKASLYQTLPLAKETFAEVMIYLLLGFFFTMLGQATGRPARGELGI